MAKFTKLTSLLAGAAFALAGTAAFAADLYADHFQLGAAHARDQCQDVAQIR